MWTIEFEPGLAVEGSFETREYIAVFSWGIRRVVGAENQFEESDYAIISTRGNKDLYLLPDEQLIYTIEESGAILAVVRKLK